MNKKLKIALSVVASVGIVAGASAYYSLGYSKEYDETKTLTVGDGKNLKVGVFSDTQLPASGSKISSQYIAMEKTLELMKKEQVEAIILAGDFTDLATADAYASFKSAFDGVFGDNKPIPIFALGNHDYWLDMFVKAHEIATPAKLQRRFTKYTGEYPYSHKIINGYHFIVWSSSNGSYDTSYSDDKWIREQLDAAVADSPDKPIFVVTHLNPQDTVYGSDDWGNKDIYNVLKDYPQVVSFSGHSHYALNDERSIWQGEFTAINTQTTDYIELEAGKFNGSIPRDALGNSTCYYPACMIMNVTPESTTLRRISVDSGEEFKEPWIINAPYGDKNAFTYTNSARVAANEAPHFTSAGNAVFADKTDKDAKTVATIEFDAASDDDFVHSYVLEFLDKDKNALSFAETNYDGSAKEDAKDIADIKYFSDFTLGIENMSSRVLLRLPSNLPENAEAVRITAVDSWGAKSEPIEAQIK